MRACERACERIERERKPACVHVRHNSKPQVVRKGEERGLQKGAPIDTQLIKGFIVL